MAAILNPNQCDHHNNASSTAQVPLRVERENGGGEKNSEARQPKAISHFPFEV